MIRGMVNTFGEVALTSSGGCWSYAMGHTGLFLLLPFEADDIARLINANVSAPRDASGVLP